METRWAVTSGCYSDWSVDWIFERKEDAEGFRDELNGKVEKVDPEASSGYGLYDISEFPYCPAGTKPKRMTGYKVHGIVGTMEVEMIESSFLEGDYRSNQYPTRPEVKEYRVNIDHEAKTCQLKIMARSCDRDAAIKSVKDRLASRMVEIA